MAEAPMRILIVDDSTYNLFVMKEILTQLKPDLYLDEALNGQAAIDKVLENTLLSIPDYDLIFLDL